MKATRLERSCASTEESYYVFNCVLPRIFQFFTWLRLAVGFCDVCKLMCGGAARLQIARQRKRRSDDCWAIGELCQVVDRLDQSFRGAFVACTSSLRTCFFPSKEHTGLLSFLAAQDDTAARVCVVLMVECELLI